MSERRALVISPRPPEFDRESGLLRVWDQIDMLMRRGWQVTFGCLRAPTDRDRYVRELEQRGVETHAPIKNLDSLLRNREFELAILSFWHVADEFLAELREAAPSTRLVVDSIDLHFLRETREQLRFEPGSTPAQLGGGHAGNVVKEINVYAAADAVLTVSAKEAALIDDLTGRPGLAMPLPDVEELPRSPIPLRKRRGILFLGNFLHAPNRDAAAYLCGEIVPRIDPSLLAEHEISIVGTAADEHTMEIAEGFPYVRTVGWVPSVLPYLQAARLTVVPLRYGAGTKRKVIQALMAGTPTVTTTVGAEGLGMTSGRQALIADDPDGFAAAVERLLRRQLAWRGLARRGRKHVLRLHGRATVESRFDEVLDAVLARTPLPPAPLPEIDDSIVRAPEYSNLVLAVRGAIESELPSGAEVLVATRGDDGFLALDGRRGWHFPRDPGGKYAGHYPVDSDAAIGHLEELRGEGATHLALPRTAFWWLDHYQGLREHLDETHRLVRSDDDVILYELAGDGAGEDREASEPPQAITGELVRGLQPATLSAAGRYRNGGEHRRALVLGVYLADQPNTAEHIARTLAASEDVEVRQRWVALGDRPSPGLESHTAQAVSEPTPKYTLLNRLLAEEDDLESYDFVLTTDDDIVLPDGFVDLFLGVQSGLGFELAQPARTLNSHVDHPIVLQQRGVLARRTLFVEIGPLVSFGRSIYDLVFPFDEGNPMGWGFENVWSHLLREREMREGIVDAVPVDHSIRAPVAHYEWADANADRDRYLAAHPHVPYEECFQVLDVVGLER